ncbi:hypothetical protein [Alienimonas chondri]|uniref:Uncharacterized protein n=1 Tax=Alienimonas chondri TaxID=2681879 RepID=A0ABX1VGB1_9PLAN|nr:hypothetical protein [Alienimonas chondri]NNJ26585.1 hypothetical protein [Alienimonas chondri]
MTIADLPPITPDPVIEAFKKDVDRTLLRENLRKTVDERIDAMQAAVDLAAEMRNATLARRAEVRAARRER